MTALYAVYCLRSDCKPLTVLAPITAQDLERIKANPALVDLIGDQLAEQFIGHEGIEFQVVIESPVLSVTQLIASSEVN